ncbi:NAD-dependent epimerase/dehydratase family protein [Streptomyces sp. NBC_00006]|uniref:D-erythronate dehydrogenase n=1 Tax=Streptomyces sp. NBC_00006 TaxID=2975619 RepID=UPI0022524999|nr:D-erythronate dehydrogenase [Streptomyces sp. NBC_00006]MCX5530188.1 NAD-dependent epimerase/dehydratase family protein [Streptomyces sp. NBC_00006]
MRIVITGGFGFLGRQVAEALLERRTFDGLPIDRLILADKFVPDESPLTADPLVEVVQGDLTDRLAELFAQPVDVVIHLAAAVSAECEADFDLGMTANLDTTRALLQAARAQSEAGGPTVRLVLASSVAVYGSDAALPLPPVVDESTLPTPQSSYGVQKRICEQLVAEYTRRGYVDGRVTRLMTVSVRPGKPNAAASGFLSGVVREPLAGLPATCPVSPDTQVALASPRRTVEGILRVAQAERGTQDGQLTGNIPVNLPALTVTVSEILHTLREVAGDAVADLVTVTPDSSIESIVGSWPASFDNTRAAALGLSPDPDFASVIRQYVADHPDAVTAEVSAATSID